MDEDLLRAAEAAIRPEELHEALALLSAGPTPHGGERPTAERLVAAGARWPALALRADRLDPCPQLPDAANLVGTAAAGDHPELLVCSHLDTSLTGDGDFDAFVTDREDPPPTLRFTDEVVDGFGLGVARAAAACALVGVAAAAAALAEAGRAHRLTLLLAAAGTHRHHPGTGQTPGGAVQYLDRHPRPAAAVLAKSGPPGILTAEPGSMFLRIRLTTRPHVVLARDRAVPAGGIPAHLGTVLAGVEEFRRRHLAARAGRTDQIGTELGVGAVQAGQTGKPDLLPGRVDLHLYMVTVPEDDPAVIATELRATLAETFADTPLRDCGLAVEAFPVHASAATPERAPINRYAHEAWQAVHGTAPADIRGWTGSTDGVVLRGLGVPTVRLGPAPLGPDPTDPRRDRFALAELLRFARLYAQIALRHQTSSTA
jgi:acetylornithine deacetylase/succinyl-diaminopimelate desuccinylase-like protein